MDLILPDVNETYDFKGLHLVAIPWNHVVWFFDFGKESGWHSFVDWGFANLYTVDESIKAQIIWFRDINKALMVKLALPSTLGYWELSPTPLSLMHDPKIKMEPVSSMVPA